MAELVVGPAVSFTVPGSSGAVTGTGPGSYLGFSVLNNSSSIAASVVLYDSATGTGLGTASVLEEIALPAGMGKSDNYARPGRAVQNGIWAVITGSVQGAIFQ
jgi:hypothetical protein